MLKDVSMFKMPAHRFISQALHLSMDTVTKWRDVARVTFSVRMVKHGTGRASPPTMFAIYPLVN